MTCAFTGPARSVHACSHYGLHLDLLWRHRILWSHILQQAGFYRLLFSIRTMAWRRSGASFHAQHWRRISSTNLAFPITTNLSLSLSILISNSKLFDTSIVQLTTMQKCIQKCQTSFSWPAFASRNHLLATTPLACSPSYMTTSFIEMVFW